MYLQLVRESFTEKATEGKLFVNGTFECFTLEDADRKLEDGGTKVYGLTAIPRGIYKVSITFSPRFNKYLIYVSDVNDFTGVRIHPGNSSKNTDGCILVGATNSDNYDDWISNSKIAYEKLHNKVQSALDRGEEVTLEIV